VSSAHLPSPNEVGHTHSTCHSEVYDRRWQCFVSE